MANWQSIRSGRQFVNLKYLRSVKSITDEIESIGPSEYNGKPQIIAVLKKCQLNCPVNSTSCKILAKQWGADIDNWVGKKVTIKVGKAPMGENMVDSIIWAPTGK